MSFIVKSFVDNGAALLSAIACVAAAALWVVSLFRMNGVAHYDGTAWRGVVSDGGVIRFVCFQDGSSYAGGWTLINDRPGNSWWTGFPPTLRVLGFGWFMDRSTEYEPGYIIPQWTVSVPYWFFVLLASPLPARWLLMRHRRRMRGFEVRRWNTASDTAAEQ